MKFRLLNFIKITFTLWLLFCIWKLLVWYSYSVYQYLNNTDVTDVLNDPWQMHWIAWMVELPEYHLLCRINICLDLYAYRLFGFIRCNFLHLLINQCCIINVYFNLNTRIISLWFLCNLNVLPECRVFSEYLFSQEGVT